MSTSVWAAPVSRLQSRYVLRFLRESRSLIRAVEVRLFSTDTVYDRTPVRSRRWEPIGDLARTAHDISKYIIDSGLPHATIVADELARPPSVEMPSPHPTMNPQIPNRDSAPEFDGYLRHFEKRNLEPWQQEIRGDVRSGKVPTLFARNLWGRRRGLTR
jgi:hypothetical protein